MSDLIAVSREEFIAYIGPRDIVLRSEPTFTDWETRGRHLVGRSWPGWRNSGDPKIYMLERAAARDAIADTSVSREAKAAAPARHPVMDLLR